jgi:heme A synthase
MGWFAFLALGLICAQGALGIFRVDYNALYGRTFAMAHGAFAQIVFAVLVAVALFTSRRWLSERVEEASPALKRCSIVTMLLVFLQLILGSVVRHNESLLGPRGHLLGAFVVVGAVVWLLKLMRDNEMSERFRIERIALMALLTLQLWLGVESWLAKFYVPSADLPQLSPAPTHAEWIRTAHYLAGTLIFATTVTVALLANRKPVTAQAAEALRPSQLEGAL